MKNRLNAYRHANVTKMKQLEELQTRYDLMVKEAEDAVQTDAGESETAAVRAKSGLYHLTTLSCFLLTSAFAN